jgi:hypothetical protein
MLTLSVSNGEGIGEHGKNSVAAEKLECIKLKKDKISNSTRSKRRFKASVSHDIEVPLCNVLVCLVYYITFMSHLPLNPSCYFTPLNLDLTSGFPHLPPAHHLPPRSSAKPAAVISLRLYPLGPTQRLSSPPTASHGSSPSRLRALRLTLQEMAAREERVCRQGCAAVSGEKWDMAARQERAVDDALLPNTAEGLQFLVRRSMHHLPLWCPTSCLTTLSGSFCWALFLALQSSDMRHLHDHATAAV